MANTLYGIESPVVAGNNPQANVAQVNGTQGVALQNSVQPIQPQVIHAAQNNQTNSVSPVTIPIQIQPQVATTQQSSSNIAQLQTNPAPTPQTYNPNNNKSNNTVDFNQIYSSYQSAFGNNNQNNANYRSGIKKSSLGTTIVTPITQNLNSIEGQYQSEYSDTINSIIGEMLGQMNNGFQYNPNDDSALKVATEYAANSTLQSLAGSGVLNSTSTNERVARIVSELIPQYEEKAHSRWLEYLGQLADTAQVVMSYDSQKFQYWKDAKDREFQEKEFNYKKQQDELENAWKRVDELGYVDNNASAILGVKAGTLSGSAREAKEEREFQLQKMREQAQLEYANESALYKLKSELDTNRSKTLAEYEYTLANKYGTSKSNSSTDANYKRYDEIIQNRYAAYDSMTKQYVVPNEENYNQLIDYLDNLYASGAISATEFTQLSAKYSKYTNMGVTGVNTSNANSGLDENTAGTWIKALDGKNKALDELGVTIKGQKKSFVNNTDAKNAVNKAVKEINDGTYTFTTNQQLMNDLKNGRFGKLRWGW